MSIRYLLYAVSGLLMFGGLAYYLATGEPWGAAFMAIIGFLNLWRGMELGRKRRS